MSRTFARAWRYARARLGRHVWIVHGRERTSGEPMTLLYSGSRENKNYLVHLMFAGPWQERYACVPGWRVPKLAARADIGHAFAAIEHESPPRCAATFHIPCWVGGEIDLARAETLRRTDESVRSDIRRTRRYGYDYVVERGTQALHGFYEHMYRPYVRNVYGERAFTVTRAELDAQIARAELLLVRAGGVPVAGHVVLHEPDGPRSWLIGVKDGDRRYVREGAIAAVYDFTLRHLAERGCRRLHAGASRPFLNDGVLRYKAKWGMRLTDSVANGFALTLTRACAAASAFLRANPFIYRAGGRLYAAHFAGGPTAPADIGALDGIDGVTLLRPAGADGEGGWTAAGIRWRV